MLIIIHAVDGGDARRRCLEKIAAEISQRNSFLLRPYKTNIVYEMCVVTFAARARVYVRACVYAIRDI